MVAKAVCFLVSIAKEAWGSVVLFIRKYETGTGQDVLLYCSI